MTREINLSNVSEVRTVFGPLLSEGDEHEQLKIVTYKSKGRSYQIIYNRECDHYAILPKLNASFFKTKVSFTEETTALPCLLFDSHLLRRMPEAAAEATSKERRIELILIHENDTSRSKIRAESETGKKKTFREKIISLASACKNAVKNNPRRSLYILVSLVAAAASFLHTRGALNAGQAKIATSAASNNKPISNSNCLLEKPNYYAFDSKGVRHCPTGWEKC